MGAVKVGYGPKEPASYPSSSAASHNSDDPALILHAQREQCRKCQIECEVVCCILYSLQPTKRNPCRHEPCEVFAQAFKAFLAGIPANGRFTFPSATRTTHSDELVNPCAYCSRFNHECRGVRLTPELLQACHEKRDVTSVTDMMSLVLS